MENTSSVAYETRPDQLAVTKIVGKFQVTVPSEVRGLFDLREGDLLEWSFNKDLSILVVTPKRAQVLTPQLSDQIEESRNKRIAKKQAEEARVATTA
jgi:AbrB family looped-hinge helix DNA binding protein